MARNFINPESSCNPPIWAQRALACLLEPGQRQHVLGDLEEEFRVLSQASPQQATVWYWRQSVLSFGPLLQARLGAYLRDTGWRMWGAILMAVLALFLWERTVAIGGGWRLATAMGPGNLLLARGVYGLLKLVGLICVGLVIAQLFKHQKSRQQPIRLNGPLLLAVFLPLIWDVWTADDFGLIALRLLILAAAWPAWLIGLRLGQHFMREGKGPRSA